MNIDVLFCQGGKHRVSDTCVRAHDLDEAAVLEAKKAAEQAIKDRDSEMELAEAQAKLAEAMAQLQAIQRMKKTSR